MSFAYLPFYTGDYLRDTRGLSMAGHGCFILLLCYCWDTQGPLPLDMEEIATICGARNQEERLLLDRIMARYFVAMTDGHYNRRMQMEIERANSISLKRKSAGAKGYQARAKQMPSKRSASAKQVHLLTPNPIPSPALPPSKVKNTLSGSQANADGARLLLEFLNQKAGRYFKPTPATLKPILARLNEGNTVSDCKAMIVHRWRAWKDNPDMRVFMRPETLFGAQKFASYIGDVPPEGAPVADQDLS